MKKYIILFFILLLGVSTASSQDKNVTIKLYQTTDVHGNFFPFDFINNRPSNGSFARVSTFMNEQRLEFGDRVLLLDGGDLLQGQPCVYYSNFVDVKSTHLCAAVMDYIGYDAAAMGNHDIETGHAVYDRWIKDCNFPILGANILTKDSKPYLPPYHIFVKDGVKIAVVGMLTQAIPAWLPENLWEGLLFADIEDTARQLLPIIEAKEKPDLIVGLFHTGVQTSEVAGFKESVGLDVARQVPGFDIVFCGHDHTPFNEKIMNIAGDSVLVINPANAANRISDVTVQAVIKDGKIVSKNITGEIVDISEIEPDEAYMRYFAKAYKNTVDYVNAEIGEFTETVSVEDAFFGPSAFIDLLHDLQLKLTKAEISLVAPLSMNSEIKAGKVYMRDMFNLYKYENLLYTMMLTGKEVRDALEYSAGLWTNQMTSEDDHLLRIEQNPHNNQYRFVKPFFAFDSAAGIRYTIDVTKPIGERVQIISMANGDSFDENRTYWVAVNSYQGSGGGGILTEGSGIPREKLTERIVFSTDKDLRFYLAEEIKKAKVVKPQSFDQWKFIPENWVEKAAARDRDLLFGNKNK